MRIHKQEYKAPLYKMLSPRQLDSQDLFTPVLMHGSIDSVLLAGFLLSHQTKRIFMV
jgi:hypothetical protein